MGIVLGPLIFLVVLEGALRLAGAGYPTAFFVPNRGAEGYTANLKFGWRFFPPRIARWPSARALPAPKGTNTFRAFVLGSSAAYGTPSDRYGFVRILEVMLEERFPGARIEVVNAAMTAINSHVALPIARDCARMQPDAFIVYMGNNEVIGPHGAGAVFGSAFQSIGLVRAYIWLNSLKMVQVLNALADPQGDWGGRMPKWQGMATFMQQILRADDPRLQTVYRHYRRNLEDIRRVALAAGANLYACTVAVNFRDSPPFASLHRPGMSQPDREEFKAEFRKGLDLFLKKKWKAAAESFEKCVAMDDRYADAHFFLAKTLERWGREPGTAAEHFLKARDLDVLRFRADSTLNQVIRDVFSGPESPSCRLVDVDRMLGEASRSPLKLAGWDFFHEHVHFTFEGNYQVASMLYREIEPLAAARLGVESNPAVEPLAPDRCAERLGFTFLEESYCDRLMLEDLVAKPPFTHQTEHDSFYRMRMAELTAKYEGKFTERGIAAALAACEKTVARHPDDLYLRKSLLNQYLELKRRDKTVEQLEVIVKAIPTDYFMVAKLAGEYMRRREDEKATALFKEALALNPYYYVPKHNLEVLAYRKRSRERGEEPQILDEADDAKPSF